MGISRHYTIGAVIPDLDALDALDGRLGRVGPELDQPLVLTRRRDERLVQVTLPGALVRRVEGGMSRLQWFEFGSMFLAVSATALLMGAIHLTTGIVVQAVLTVAAVIGILLYHRQPKVREKLTGMAMPEKLAEEWEQSFSDGLALVLITVPEESFEEVEAAFLEDPGLCSPLAVDRRPVL
ncbi:hypothetical protein [Rubrobacter aplysinae]|uniref:hypothetical protein n=1 Tax=Rubrobacter aplysinae TaxID=909625 RepID=UPI00064BBBFA|nr:hypothetical protein [Rubrobacter aplysinae]